jgi:hypothetical protein
MDNVASAKFLEGAYETLVGAPCVVMVGRHKYKVRQVAQAVKERIILLEQEAHVLEERGKQGLPLKEAKRITKKLYSLHSKKAAYYLLGNWAIFLKPLWWMQWNILQLRGNETTFKINEAGVVNADLGFSKANWDISRQERVLYMRPVGEVARQQLERLESVINMLEKDALGIKEGDK